MLIGELAGDELVVLLDQCLGANPEFVTVGVGPPVDQVAVAVVLGTLIIEAMADLMSDDGSDPTVVGGVVGIRVEEWGLQNRRGKDDFVHARVVVRIHRLRSHEPFVAIDGSGQFGQSPIAFGGGGAPDIAQQIVAANGDRRIVAPRGRVADLGGEFVELLQGPFAGLGCHPFQIGDAHPVRFTQVVDENLHTRLGIRGEVACHVKLPHGLAE
ncbi:Uncharacterised protein [Mycobacteroides abscessus subsp. abscessus]|nr:Uncharacterised protein [Mycobacteroides abscessus subsp. abscessus]